MSIGLHSAHQSLKLEIEKRVAEIKQSLDRLLNNFEVDLDNLE
jgi:hypothetical protein